MRTIELILRMMSDESLTKEDKISLLIEWKERTSLHMLSSVFSSEELDKHREILSVINSSIKELNYENVSGHQD